MGKFAVLFKPVVAAFAVLLLNSAPLAAQGADLEALYERLADPETGDWESVERQISGEWSRSGSTSMDLLLERGRKAMEDEDWDAALEHLTALTDHAPDFAEGWNARATAFFNKEMYGPALEDIQRVIALNPRHFGAITGLAIILQQLGFDDEALEAWRAVEALHPHRPEMQEAVKVLSKAVEGQAL